MTNLKFVNFKDFKSRWGLQSKFSIESLYYYFNFFRDSLIELEDDNLISKYIVEYGSEKSIIYKELQDDDLDSKLEKLFDEILSKSGLQGDNKGELSIYTNIFLPSSQFKDITSITERIIDCVKFLKDNGGDLGFECNLKTNSPEGLRIEIIKKL
jgi:hypothetical protein